MTITRRQALALCTTPLLAQTRPRVAITMDDARWQLIPDDRRPEAEQRLLSHLGKTRAFLFPIGEVVDNPHGMSILSRWSAEGHRIGNHTYSHRLASGGTMTPEEFEADILRNGAVLRGYSGFREWFRFPMLKEGQTREIRDRFRSFLARHGYRNGAVTIDTSDWYYDQRLRMRIEVQRGFDVSRFRQPYLVHIWDRAQFYEQLSRDVVGRSVPHTILVHYNLLNSIFLGDVLSMFRSKGSDVIDAEDAFSDELFARQPDTAPVGESLVWERSHRSSTQATDMA